MHDWGSEDYNVLDALMDNAGAFYSWFGKVELNENSTTLTIEVADDYRYALLPDQRESVTATLSGVEMILSRMIARKQGNRYDRVFYMDCLDHNWDEADGDMNSVDLVLQYALWGEEVFA